MSTKNTTPELLDGDMGADEQPELMSQEDILMNENDIFTGILEASQVADKAENYRKIQIKRKGKLLFEFRLRSISEDESQKCWRKATKYAFTKPGQPKKPIETDNALYRSYLIYTATVDEDRAKIWDNLKAQGALNILQGVDMVDRVLLAGEKDRVLDIIDEMSGYNDYLEELSGN